MAEKHDWDSLSEAEQKTVLNRTALGNIPALAIVVGLGVTLYRFVNDGAWINSLIFVVVAIVLANLIYPDKKLMDQVIDRSWWRSAGFALLLAPLGAGIASFFENETDEYDEVVKPQMTANQSTVETLPQSSANVLTAKVKVQEGPTFDETRQWILAKYKRYSSIREYQGTYKRAIYNAGQITDTVGKGRLHIDSCQMSSLMLEGEVDSYFGDDEFRSTFYAKFKLKNIESVSYDPTLSAYRSPHFDMRFSTSGTTDARSSSGKVTNGNSRTIEIHFSDDESEENLIGRMESAFYRLKELAENNPDCADAVETF